MQNSKPKQLVFKILLIFSPLVILLLAEGVLRLFNYGGDRSLVVEEIVGGRQVYALNANVTRRYFTQKDLQPAVYTEQTFAKEKSPKTYRIFCLGESTTYGFPYPPNINFPVFLKQRLQTLFPDRHFEVINVGMTAINSYAVADFVKELVHYQPDLFLLYMGHNEFYGALGSASTEGWGRSRTLIRLNLTLQRFKIYVLMRDMASALSSLFHGKAKQSRKGQILMARMIGKSNIGIGSKEHQIAIQNFIDNLLEIIETAQRHKVKILVSTLVCNLKDQVPFETALIPPPKQITWDNYATQGDKHWENGDSAKADFLYQRALEIFPESADANFILGRRYLKIGNRLKARTLFETALDLDLMPFRARTEFNRVLLAICADKRVPVVPMHQIFDLNSKDNIPGLEVFTEHVHPNHLGYFLMAKQFCISMYENDCVAPKSQWDLSRNLPDELYWQNAPITPLDDGIAQMRTEIMRKSWPFQQQELPDSLRIPKLATPIDTIAYYHIGDRIDWATAHQKVAEYLVRHGQYETAKNEYKAILGVEPDNLNAHLGIAELYFLQKQFEGATEWLKAALKLHPESPYPPARLGLVALAKNDNESAINYFEHASVLQEASKAMPENEFLQVRFHLAAAYAFAGERLKAKNILQEILKQKPAYAEAQELLNQL
ncbi:MAG: tetratricopeptide repeat protein [candidate division KSB1 bacterium]|nr:tetratricopeptide repeat protein [candidate division KSB1 bacterium]MDZ7302764.1 tetratricopeptide repeat protein [candidate division KSB1 bacterium]MDZ7310069.1 tetratricopeptide repeat protein [candidate division KSB1 bacterium]